MEDQGLHPSRSSKTTALRKTQGWDACNQSTFTWQRKERGKKKKRYLTDPSCFFSILHCIENTEFSQTVSLKFCATNFKLDLLKSQKTATKAMQILCRSCLCLDTKQRLLGKAVTAKILKSLQERQNNNQG